MSLLTEQAKVQHAEGGVFWQCLSPWVPPTLSQWVPAPRCPPHLVPTEGAAGMGARPGCQPCCSSLTVSRVEEQLHLLPQGPDHIAVAI